MSEGRAPGRALGASVRTLPGVGEKRAEQLKKIGIASVGDFLRYFPRDYEDRSKMSSIFSAVEGETVCIRATVASQPSTARIRKGLSLTKLKAFDETGVLELTFFNQDFIKNQLVMGREYIFYGRIEPRGRQKGMLNPDFEEAGRQGELTGRILPVYPLTQGISRKIILSGVKAALAAAGTDLPDYLPAQTEARYRLMGATEAYHKVHFPDELGEAIEARRRFIFEEFFLFSCAARLSKQHNDAMTGCVMGDFPPELFLSAVPYPPTDAQKRAMDEAYAHMRSGRRMNRLLQGDVGSGKTLVAAYCAFLSVKSGYQVAVMAPTEILARQLHSALHQLLAPHGVRSALLTASTPKKARGELISAAREGLIDLLVGTHALIQEDVQFHRPGLFVIDEQHRFGVRQRALLGQKGEGAHTLVMSATPIPRTLTLMIYGDLDVSVLDELPPGRKEIKTYVAGRELRPRVGEFIRRQVEEEGGQVYVVCPLIEEGEEPGVRRPAEQVAEELAGRFPKLRVALLHGRMKAKQKEETMAAFARGEVDILVSTTVIEVGVNVPNATLMVIENADLFGLSQLHQLRGRVGRGERQSHCVLMREDSSETARRRLDVLKHSSDGFFIAQEDLKIRGPGDFFGSRQHGLPTFQVADLAQDIDVLRDAQQEATLLLERDPGLREPENALIAQQVRRVLTGEEHALN